MNELTETMEPHTETLPHLEPMSDSEKNYTPFLPIFIVFIFFVLSAAVQLYINVQAKHNIDAALGQLVKGAVQAKAKSDALSGLAHDLVDLSASSAPAQQIVNDFRIQIKNPPAANAPADKAAAAPATAPAAATPAKQ